MSFTQKFGQKKSEMRLYEIPLKDIETKAQVRSAMNEESITKLANAIKREGLHHPITVRKHEDRYIVLMGHRRYAAFEKLKMKTIPCFIETRDLTQRQITTLQLIENLQREDLSAIDEARGYEKLKKEGLSGKDIAECLGVSPAKVAQGLKVAELPEEWLTNMADLSMYNIYNVAKVKNENSRQIAYEMALRGENFKIPKRKIKRQGKFTEEELDVIWKKIKGQYRRNKSILEQIISPSKLQKYLEE
jgi:ParB/RepB/Spo0J family partition protein